jgi:hypothetical protein
LCRFEELSDQSKSRPRFGSFGAIELCHSAEMHSVAGILKRHLQKHVLILPKDVLCRNLTISQTGKARPYPEMKGQTRQILVAVDRHVPPLLVAGDGIDDLCSFTRSGMGPSDRMQQTAVGNQSLQIGGFR